MSSSQDLQQILEGWEKRVKDELNEIIDELRSTRVRLTSPKANDVHCEHEMVKLTYQKAPPTLREYKKVPLDLQKAHQAPREQSIEDLARFCAYPHSPAATKDPKAIIYLPSIEDTCHTILRPNDAPYRLRCSRDVLHDSPTTSDGGIKGLQRTEKPILSPLLMHQDDQLHLWVNNSSACSTGSAQHAAASVCEEEVVESLHDVPSTWPSSSSVPKGGYWEHLLPLIIGNSNTTHEDSSGSCVNSLDATHLDTLDVLSSFGASSSAVPYPESWEHLLPMMLTTSNIDWPSGSSTSSSDAYDQRGKSETALSDVSQTHNGIQSASLIPGGSSLATHPEVLHSDHPQKPANCHPNLLKNAWRKCGYPVDKKKKTIAMRNHLKCNRIQRIVLIRFSREMQFSRHSTVCCSSRGYYTKSALGNDRTWMVIEWEGRQRKKDFPCRLVWDPSGTKSQ